MNPFTLEGAKEIVGKAAENAYGINPYEDKGRDLEGLEGLEGEVITGKEELRQRYGI